MRWHCSLALALACSGGRVATSPPATPEPEVAAEDPIAEVYAWEAELRDVAVVSIAHRQIFLAPPTEDEVARFLAANEAQVLHEYETGRHLYENQEETVRARQVFFRASSDDPSAPRERCAHARALVMGGRAFVDVAREESEDEGSVPSGGDLGFFRRDQMVEELGNVAFSLPVGEVSECFQTTFGMHFIEVLERRAAGTVPREEALREIATKQKMKEDRATMARAILNELAVPRLRAGDAPDAIAVSIRDRGALEAGSSHRTWHRFLSHPAVERVFDADTSGTLEPWSDGRASYAMRVEILGAPDEGLTEEVRRCLSARVDAGCSQEEVRATVSTEESLVANEGSARCNLCADLHFPNQLTRQQMEQIIQQLEEQD